ncbi:hypothetical protein OROMI_015171 [Orobanche minor]
MDVHMGTLRGLADSAKYFDQIPYIFSLIDGNTCFNLLGL